MTQYLARMQAFLTKLWEDLREHRHAIRNG
jgi:hypothetical protein